MMKKNGIALILGIFWSVGLLAQEASLKEHFDGTVPARVGRGECTVSGGVLRTRDAYACFGDTGWTDYAFSFRAMAPADAPSTSVVVPSGEVHICAGFRAGNRDDRYILGLKGGSFNALYLERMGFMGTDDYLALRPLEFPVKPGEWYRFRVEVAGDRFRIYLNDEKLPRIDVRDPNFNLCPHGQITLGGSYIETLFDDLDVEPLKAIRGSAKEWTLPAPDKEAQRKAERAAYQPLALASASEGRTELSLDGNWLFCPGYELGGQDDAISPKKDDRSWHVLTVPNFWNPSRVWLHGEKYKNESKGASDRYYQQEINRCASYSFDYTRTDVGWYRQWITLPAGVQGKHMELSFDAVSKVAEVWINGHKAGSHIGMFGDFTLDVSAFLHPGKNLVTVEVQRNYVNNIQDANKIQDVAVTVEVTQKMVKDLAHGFFVDDPAGIWQPVKLTITDPLHISDVFIKPGLTGASFDVTVRNDGTSDRTFALNTTIDSLYTGISQPSVTLKAGEERTLSYSVEGLHPKLWSPETPNLYHFQFGLRAENAVAAPLALGGIDTFSLTSGFRTFEAKDGFLYLNGHRYWLRGANQTAMPLGPNNTRLADRFCQLMHDAHINATRTHTVPFTETWLDAADREGLGVSYEGTWPWLMIQSTMPDQALIDLWEKEFLDLLRKYRNHPSLLLWTVNNEMKFYDNDPDAERAKTKMRIISGVVKKMRKIDPTRPVVFDSNYDRNTKKYGSAFFQEVDDGDIDDIHMYPNWYDNSIFDQFNGEFQAKHKNPGRPLISQEMSTGYSNNETGHPVRFYTFVHQTPQALIGKYAYDYNDPYYFLHTHAFITKEIAEAFRRTDDQASGILHFAAITWFRYVYLYDSIQPYPVYYAMQKAMEPVLVSAELWGRHFYAGTRMPVRVCVVNDEDDTVLASPSVLQWILEGKDGAALASGSTPVPAVPYYGRSWITPDVEVPASVGDRIDARLVFRLVKGTRQVSDNDYDVVLAGKSTILSPGSLVDLSGRMGSVLPGFKVYASVDAALDSATGPLVLAGLNLGNTSPSEIKRIRDFVSKGGKVLLLNPGTMAATLYPSYIKGLVEGKEEIMSMEIPESPVFSGIEPLDLRNFNNGVRETPFVCSGGYQVNRSPNLSLLASFTKVHGYLSGDMAERVAKVGQIRGYPIVEIRDGGEIFLSQVSMEKAATDPVAGRLLKNLIEVLNEGPAHAAAGAAGAAPDPLHPDYVSAPAQPWEKPFSAFAFHTLEKDGHVLPYRLYTPPVIEPGKKYPLVIFFHGAGERGLDNRYQFFRFAPFPFWEKYACYVIAPQCPPKGPNGGPDGESTWVATSFGAPSSGMKPSPTWPMQLAMEAISQTIRDNAIDTSRVYVTGLSMGGFATWEILQREPGLFAAAMPVCGGADTSYAPVLKDIPLWVFHGSADSTVLPSRSRAMVACLRRAGGEPKYTEFPGVGHGAWAKTYPDKTVWDWLFAQHKDDARETASVNGARPADGLRAARSLRLPPLVGDNMVLQRDQPLPIWGWAKPGERVTVGFNGKTYETSAAGDGKWQVTLDPSTAGGPYEMTINNLHLHNILVGDVWLCSGQSNMVLDFNNDRVKALYTDDIAASSCDGIRQLLVARDYADEPASDFRSPGWKSASPQSLPAFSAAAYFFAKTLYQKYHVPIGIINSSNGGTTAEAWTSQEGLSSFPQFAHGFSHGVAEPKNFPSVLYNAMIAPLVPYAIKGVVWYQGEYNTHRAFEYRRLFPALIADWRKQWANPALPFIYQQLPNFQTPVSQPSENEWAELREAQLMTLNAAPHTAMAVAIDIGGNNELHPADKKDVGIRLALQAEHLAYGAQIVSSGPLYRDMKVEGSRVILSFDDVGSGLVTRGDSLAYFAVAGADRHFVWADAVIRGNTVIVSSPQVPSPVAVRYAWAGDPRGCNLYNREGLPASPFRTDDWPGLTVNN